jgi:hypothetical protein
MYEGVRRGKTSRDKKATGPAGYPGNLAEWRNGRRSGFDSHRTFGCDEKRTRAAGASPTIQWGRRCPCGFKSCLGHCLSISSVGRTMVRWFESRIERLP